MDEPEVLGRMRCDECGTVFELTTMDDGGSFEETLNDHIRNRHVPPIATRSEAEGR
jgi:hypothetical protein